MSQLEKAVKCRSGFQELCSKSKTTTIKKKKIQSPETVKRVMEKPLLLYLSDILR